MKISVADNQSLKFDAELLEYWKSKGHEVKYEMGASEHLFQWCDLYYINFWDNNVNYLYKWHLEHPEVKKPQIVVRVLDWDYWCGFIRNQEQVNWVDKIICIASHIARRIEKEVNVAGKLFIIKPGIDLEKWPLRELQNNKKIIMFVNEIDWYLKHTIEGLKIFTELLEYDKDYHLTIKGKWCQTEYFQELIRHYVKINWLEEKVVFDDGWTEDLNGYLEPFDYLLLPSLKEAFSFVTAQCAAKGIKPVLNWWMGAEEVWPKEWLYRTVAEAIKIFEEKPEPVKYRKVVEERYDLERMVSEYDALLGT